MSTAPSYTDDVFKALGIPSDLQELEGHGIKVVDPIAIGEDYPFKLQVRRIGTGSLEEIEGRMSDLPDISSYGLELIVFAQLLTGDGTLSKILLARPLEESKKDPTRMLGRGQWIQFEHTGTEVCCIPRPISSKINRKINPDADQRCGNCRLWDRQLGKEEYVRVTHPESLFGGDRQMWKDISDYEAKERRLRRLDPERVGLCLDTDTIYDRDMECCDSWESE